MDKRKLVNIIVKDLEEIRLLAEEVVESHQDASLIVHLALNRARLLCQEIELLHELTEKTIPIHHASAEAVSHTEDQEDEELSDLPYSDPELEILNFEERDFSVSDQSFETEEETGQTEDDLEEDLEEEHEKNDLQEEEEDLRQEPLEEDQDEEEDDLTEEDLEEEEDQDEEEEDLEEEEEEQTEEPEEELEPEPEIHHTELKKDLPPGMREIHIDDQDDEYEIEPLRSAPFTGSPFRSPMREIPKPGERETPKPEETEPVKPEKLVVGEKYQKERSLNDTIGENQSIDSKLTNNRITSLRAAIGLNDRFLFIREIFGNNSEKYNTIIERLDKMETIQEAVEYLKANLTMEKNEASMKFVELLKRRFPK